MKQKVLKQAYLPDALTWELSQRYDLYDLALLSDTELQAVASEIAVVITNVRQ